jgi:uncharacterized protein YegP (UPF0339 family)/transcriptional regulator with XRE-family HTH domain
MRTMAKTAKPAPSPKDADDAAVLAVSVTLNQVVGYNMTWYRKAAGLTQEELGQRLGGWTKVAVSAAERSWDGKRVRKFDADELVGIARALGVPVPALFLPPHDAGTAVIYELEGNSETEPRTQLTELLPYLLPSPDDQSPVMAAFRNRLIALGASHLTEADVKAIPTDAIVNAESIELDAVEQNRMTLDSLMMERDRLERQIDELRTFERDYRARLLAYLERQIMGLRSEATDKRRFVLKKGSSGRYHFNLVAPSGQVIATSEAYERKQSALNGIESVKSSASYAEVDDQTGDRPSAATKSAHRTLGSPGSLAGWPLRPEASMDADC